MEGSYLRIKVCYFGMHLQNCKYANPEYVREQRGRYKSSICVQGQSSGEATPWCVQNQLCRAAVYAACMRKRMEQEGGVHVRSNRKGEHKTEKEITEGKERKTENMGEDAQSVAQTRKRRWREEKERNKGNICHTQKIYLMKNGHKKMVKKIVWRSTSVE